MNTHIRTGVIAAVVTGGSILGLGQIGTVSAQIDDAPGDDEPSEAPEGECPGRRGGNHLEPLAEILGMDPEVLREQLRGGATLADVADERGVPVETVVDTIVDATTERIEGAVEEGRITREQADERLADLEERVTTRVDEGRPERGEGREGFRGPRGPRGPRGEAPADAPADA